MRYALTLLCLWPAMALAHATEGGFVLLLPTDLYIAGGGVVVALTVLLLALAPAWHPERLFGSLRLPRFVPAQAAALTQIAALAGLCALLWAGAFGATDPLRNPLTLGLWTVFWIGIVTVQALVFDIWRWLNPFAGLARLLPGRISQTRPPAWIAPVLFLAFSGFLLADPAPADPGRLAVIAAGYLAATALALAVFGPGWLVRGEFLTVMLRCYRQTAIFGSTGLGLNGWRILRLGAPTLPIAALMLMLLGSGSFDGVNETFWWLGILGVNPLEFPGRSAVIAPTLTGLAAVNLGLIMAYTAAIALGLRLAGGGSSLAAAFTVFAPSILPIAAAYHLAHYLTSFLIDGQHVLAAFSAAFGLGERPVTTGFLNRLDTVETLWLVQAGAVVIGHVVAILTAHALALRLFGDARRATLSQLPLALFMVAYTVFGLWLLAAPKGA